MELPFEFRSWQGLLIRKAYWKFWGVAEAQSLNCKSPTVINLQWYRYRSRKPARPTHHLIRASHRTQPLTQPMRQSALMTGYRGKLHFSWCSWIAYGCIVLWLSYRAFLFSKYDWKIRTLGCPAVSVRSFNEQTFSSAIGLSHTFYWHRSCCCNCLSSATATTCITSTASMDHSLIGALFPQLSAFATSRITLD